MNVSRCRVVSKSSALLLVAAALGIVAVCVVGIRPAPLAADEPQATSEKQQKDCMTLLREVQRLRSEVQRLNTQLESLSQEANRLARRVLAEADTDVHPKASVDDKYSHLLRKIAVPEDQGVCTDFCDWGHWSGTSWQGHTDLPAGYWVYVFPHWYIWRDCREK